MQFYWPVRVYYEDTDAEGVVYYANYLKFFERARTEWLRSRGVDLLEMQQNDGVVFVVTSAQINYRRPAGNGNCARPVLGWPASVTRGLHRGACRSGYRRK